MAPIKRKKPNAIVFDVTGTVAKKAFMAYSEESKNFLRENIKAYLAESWGRKELRLAINFLRQAKPFPGSTKMNQPGIGTPPVISDITAPLEEQVETVIQNVLWRLDKEGLSSGLGYFHLYMSEWGYRKGILLTPVYEEAPEVLKNGKTKITLSCTLHLVQKTFSKVFSL